MALIEMAGEARLPEASSPAEELLRPVVQYDHPAVPNSPTSTALEAQYLDTCIFIVAHSDRISYKQEAMLRLQSAVELGYQLPLESICLLINSQHVSVVSFALQIISAQVSHPVPVCLTSSLFILRLADIIATLGEESVIKEASDLMDALLWQSSYLQDVYGAETETLSDSLAVGLTEHLIQSMDEPSCSELHCFIRLLTASKVPQVVSNVLLSGNCLIKQLVDAICIYEFENDRIRVLACSVLSISTCYQSSLPDDIFEIFEFCNQELLDGLKSLMKLCHPRYILPILAIMIIAYNNVPHCLLPKVEFIKTICSCVSWAYENASDCIDTWIVPICILLNSSIQTARMTKTTDEQINQEADRVVGRANQLVGRILRRHHFA